MPVVELGGELEVGDGKGLVKEEGNGMGLSSSSNANTSKTISNHNNSSKNINTTQPNKQKQKQKQPQEPSIPEPKLQIIRTIQTLDHHYIDPQSKKPINKQQKLQKKPKKVITPLTTTLFLRYNKLTSIDNFLQYVTPIFPNPSTHLMWIDLSHNRLTQLTPDLGQLPALKTLYLHANYISDFAQLTKLKPAPLRTLTIHANPLEQYEEFRIVIHGILPSLRKIDSALLTKRESQRAEVLGKSGAMGKLPVVKNVKLWPEESEDQGDS